MLTYLYTIATKDPMCVFIHMSKCVHMKRILADFVFKAGLETERKTNLVKSWQDFMAP